MRDVPTPFEAYKSEVGPEWLDYNGHMNDASYAVALSEANEQLLAWLGLSADYRAETGAALYTVETHIRFLAECTLGQTLTATSMMVAADEKRVRVFTELFVEGDRLAATGESMYVHVDPAAGGPSSMSPDRQRLLQEMVTAHAGLPRPAALGRGVGAR
jgi:acyl-CoA thioesterase FadM